MPQILLGQVVLSVEFNKMQARTHIIDDLTFPSAPLATFATFEEYAKIKILISGLILDRIALVPENELAHAMAVLSNDLMKYLFDIDLGRNKVEEDI